MLTQREMCGLLHSGIHREYWSSEDLSDPLVDSGNKCLWGVHCPQCCVESIYRGKERGGCPTGRVTSPTTTSCQMKVQGPPGDCLLSEPAVDDPKLLSLKSLKDNHFPSLPLTFWAFPGKSELCALSILKGRPCLTCDFYLQLGTNLLMVSQHMGRDGMGWDGMK